MRWQRKAQVMKLMAFIRSEQAYVLMQRAFGRLQADPMARIPTHIEMLGWLEEHGYSPADKVVFEVGTGNLPVVPVGFFLAGASRVLTVDLNRRLDARNTSLILKWMHENRTEMHRRYDAFVAPHLLEERLDLVGRLHDDVPAFLRAANIEYRAPYDATRTDLPGASIDIHFSVKTLEHAPREDIAGILAEARRLIRPDGVSCHLIDLSDHFSHQDPSIPSINFLRFSKGEWLKIAGNKYAYTNRMRPADYEALFAELDLAAVTKKTVDPEAEAALAAGFPVDEAYAGTNPQELCTTFLDVLLTRRLKAAEGRAGS